MKYPKSNTMTPKIKDGIVYYVFNCFDEMRFIKHGFSTRLGGVSQGVWQSMNLGFSRGDNDQDVHENYKLMCSAMDIDPKNLVISSQTHNTAHYNATKSDRGRGIYTDKGYTDIDGLLTNQHNVALCTLYADCVPLMFVDPVKKVVASSHAGWKGTLMCIGAKTVSRMISDYGCNTSDIVVGIAPSIGQCCFEVDLPVANEFTNNFEHWDNTVEEKENAHGDGITKYHIDLWEINKRTLMDSGILEKNIFISNLCTRCNSDIFWSHRALGLDRGTLAAFIEIDK